MRSPKYPLEPVVELRTKKVDDAARQLSAAARERAAASGARQLAERRREDHEQEVARVRATEDEALARGELRAVDLARAGTWSVRVGSESEVLAAGVERARAGETRARQTEGSARTAALSRRAEARVALLHRAHWDEARRKEVEAREDEASSEAWRPKR